MRGGQRLRDVWLDSRPEKCLRTIACQVICYCWAGSEQAPLVHSRLTERELEKRFGRTRSCYASAQMSAADYFRASAFLMQKEVKSAQDTGLPPQADVPPAMSPNTFCATASRAFQAALKLASMSSGRSRTELQSAFNLARAPGSNVAEDEDDSDMEGWHGSNMIVSLKQRGSLTVGVTNYHSRPKIFAKRYGYVMSMQFHLGNFTWV